MSSNLVQVYFNLHKRCWSVRDKKTRRVIEHTDYATIRNPRFVVSETGRQRVIREKRKNVHAYVEGEWWEGSIHTGGITIPVIYNPYKHKSFVVGIEEHLPIEASTWAVMEVTENHPVVCVPSILRSCAFCGSYKITVGHESVTSFAGRCRDCGARGPVFNLPDRMPEGVENLNELEKILTRQALEGWNNRSS
jgi:hypothetical protein